VFVAVAFVFIFALGEEVGRIKQRNADREAESFFDSRRRRTHDPVPPVEPKP